MRTAHFSILLILLIPFACKDAGVLPPTGPLGYKIAYFTDEFSALHVIGVDGSNDIAITPFLGKGSSVDWLPDGSALIFSDAVTYPLQDTASVWFYSTRDGQKRLLFSRTQVIIKALTISPDGQQVACIFAHYQDVGADLTVFQVRGGNPHSLTLLNQNLASCQWSPDGSRIIFALDTSICTIKPDGSGFTQLIATPGYKSDPSYSPDGAQIVYALRYFNGNHAICLMNSDGSNAHLLTPLRLAFLGSPKWSPDGTLIVFLQDDNSYLARVFRIDPDGGNIKQITFSPGVHFDPNWLSSDRIAYLSNDTQDLWSVDKEGIGRRQITHISPDLRGSLLTFAPSKSSVP